jgi:hypothetical protein
MPPAMALSTTATRRYKRVSCGEEAPVGGAETELHSSVDIILLNSSRLLGRLDHLRVEFFPDTLQFRHLIGVLKAAVVLFGKVVGQVVQLLLQLPTPSVAEQFPVTYTDSCSLAHSPEQHCVGLPTLLAGQIGH